MNNTGLAPYCELPITNQAREYTPSYATDISKRFEQYSVSDLQDDYELVDSQDWLDGGFK